MGEIECPFSILQHVFCMLALGKFSPSFLQAWICRHSFLRLLFLNKPWKQWKALVTLCHAMNRLFQWVNFFRVSITTNFDKAKKWGLIGNWFTHIKFLRRSWPIELNLKKTLTQLEPQWFRMSKCWYLVRRYPVAFDWIHAVSWLWPKIEVWFLIVDKKIYWDFWGV